MLSWLKNRFSKVTAEDEDEFEFEAAEDEKSYSPVGVRVRPTGLASPKPADTYIAGYNVDEAEIGLDENQSTTVNDIKTTGVDPYNAGGTDQ